MYAVGSTEDPAQFQTSHGRGRRRNQRRNYEEPADDVANGIFFWNVVKSLNLCAGIDYEAHVRYLDDVQVGGEPFGGVRVPRTPADKVKILLSEKLFKMFHPKDSVAQTPYPYLRLLLPDSDFERSRWNLRESKLLDLIKKSQSWESSTPFYRLLLNNLSKTGDLALAWYNTMLTKENFREQFGDIFEDRKQGLKEVPTVRSINDWLNELYNATDSNQKEELVRFLLTNYTACEVVWVFRIILKDLKINVRKESLLKVVHPDAVATFNMHSDLRRLCATLTDPNERFTPEIELGVPTTVMLSNAATIKSIKTHLRQKKFLVEQKMDGERLVVHVDLSKAPGKDLTMYSRKQKDYTFEYGTTLGRSIVEVLKRNGVSRCILDGEILSYCGLAENFEPFGTVKATVAAEHAALRAACGGSLKVATHEEVEKATRDMPKRLVYITFDVLFCVCDEIGVSGSVMGKRLSERRGILERVVGQGLLNRFEVIKTTKIDASNMSADQVYKETTKQLDNAVRNRWEGLVLKTFDSAYSMGEQFRIKNLWMKLKPEHVGRLNDEVDAVVVGTSAGKITVSLGILASVFHCAVRSDNGQWIYAVRVGSGFTNDELIKLNKKLAPHMVRYDPTAVRHKKQAPYLNSFKFTKDIPNFLIDDPKNSVVLEVVGSDVHQTSGGYGTTHTLRFPRCKRIRYDKSVEDAWSLKRFNEFVQDVLEGKIRIAAEEKRAMENDRSVFSKKRKTDNRERPVRRRLKASVAREYKILIDKPLVIGSVFEGNKLCVGSLRAQIQRTVVKIGPKKSMELEYAEHAARLWVMFGGELSANPSSECLLLGTQEKGITAENSRKTENSISVEFLKECVERGEMFEPKFRHYETFSEQKLKELRELEIVDEYHDAFCYEIDEETFRRLYKRRKNNEDVEASQSDAEKIDEYEMEHGMPMRTAKVCAKFVSPTELRNAFESLARAYGAEIVADKDATHLVVAEGDEGIAHDFLEKQRPSKRPFVITTSQLKKNLLDSTSWLHWS